MDCLKDDIEYDKIEKIATNLYSKELGNAKDICLQQFIKIIRNNLVDLNISSAELIDSILDELNQTYISQKVNKDLFIKIYCETYFMLSAVGPIGDVIDEMSLSVRSDDDKLEYN